MPKIIVTGHADGKSTVARTFERPKVPFDTMPEFSAVLVWSTGETCTIPLDHDVDPAARDSVLPAIGEVNLLIVTYPPDSTAIPEGFDPAAFGAEMLAKLPGLAERFEASGMHTTDTIDFGVILSGDLVLKLDDGETVALTAGDIVIQNGTRHGWSNPGNTPTTVAFTMTGAKRKGSNES